MENPLQKDRIYSLIVGDEGSAFEVDRLNIKFEVKKSSSNSDKKNRAFVEIYNLTEEKRKALEKDYIQIKLMVGYSKIGLETLFVGQIINLTNSRIKRLLSKRNGTDIITRLELDEMYEELNHKVQKRTAPEGSKVSDAIKIVLSYLPDVTRSVFSGSGINRVLHDGYPIHSTPLTMLNRLAYDFDLEWSIDNGTFYVSDRYTSYTSPSGSVPLINQKSGLVGQPEFVSGGDKRKRYSAKVMNPDGQNEKKGRGKNPRLDSIKLTILLNPTIKAGGIIKLEYPDLTGYYKVDEVSHKGEFLGNDWYSELICSERF